MKENKSNIKITISNIILMLNSIDCNDCKLAIEVIDTAIEEGDDELLFHLQPILNTYDAFRYPIRICSVFILDVQIRLNEYYRMIVN